MARYKDVEPIEKFLKETDTEGLNVQELKNLIKVTGDIIELLPTADVQEVRHGTWEKGENNLYAICTACGGKINYSCYGYAYCALCGARMDGEA